MGQNYNSTVPIVQINCDRPGTEILVNNSKDIREMKTN